METEKVDSWLRKNSDSIGIDYSGVESTNSGESNHNFVVDAGEKMILRVSRDISRNTRLKNEAKTLDFLEKTGVENVPRKIYFEEDTEIGEILLETYVGEKDVNSDNLNDKKLKALAEKIAEIHSIPPESYENFSGTSTEEEKLDVIFRRDFRKWSKRPYNEYLELSDSPDERIEHFYQKQKNLLEEVPEKPVEKTLTHGDLGFNARSTGDSIFIIDWEFSRINLPENEILYLFEHGELSSREREVFLEKYGKDRELNESFEELREIYPKFLAFNDMIWAAKRVEQGDDKQDLFEKRMNKLEKYYH